MSLSHRLSLNSKIRKLLFQICALFLYLSVRSHAFSSPSFRSVRPLTLHQFDPRTHIPSSTKLLHSPWSDSSFFVVDNLMTSISRDQAEMIAGPFFGASLFPYLLFLYFLNVPNNQTPKGVVVGFATCLLFVFLTIPAAIAAQYLYGVSLADSDWLHASAESLLTITNIITVLGFRQALSVSFQSREDSYIPMTLGVLVLTIVAGLTAWIPALFFGAMTQAHFPYLGGFLDIPPDVLSIWDGIAHHTEPDNALTVGCWIIHISSLVEFLIAMGFVWQWADVTGNPKWKGVTWGLLPLHTSGIIACTYHLFYNQLPVLVPLQALMTLIGNTTAAYAAYRLAVSNGWKFPGKQFFPGLLASVNILQGPITQGTDDYESKATDSPTSSSSWMMVGFEDLGPAFAADTDATFVIKLFVGCTVASYAVKYGELLLDFPFDADIYVALAIIFSSSALNAFKWLKRSEDPSFDGWF